MFNRALLEMVMIERITHFLLGKRCYFKSLVKFLFIYLIIMIIISVTHNRWYIRSAVIKHVLI